MTWKNRSGRSESNIACHKLLVWMEGNSAEVSFVLD